MPRNLAVLGSPIAHSKSPALHRAAYGVLGRDWQYGSAELGADDLAGFLAGRDESWLGLSLTMPLKHAAYGLSDDRDEAAELTGAVNTLRLADGGLHGFNTDVDGIVRAVTAAGTPRVSRALILGSGATAASALVAATRLGATRVDVAARRTERAAPIADLAARLGVFLDVRPFSAGLVDDDDDLVVATLPGGVAAPETYSERMRRSALLLDVAYAPWPSALAMHWASAGGRVINGLAMLVHQALLQVRIFDTGDPRRELPKEDAVLAAMHSALDLPRDGLMPAAR